MMRLKFSPLGNTDISLSFYRVNDWPNSIFSKSPPPPPGNDDPPTPGVTGQCAPAAERQAAYSQLFCKQLSQLSASIPDFLPTASRPGKGSAPLHLWFLPYPCDQCTYCTVSVNCVCVLRPHLYTYSPAGKGVVNSHNKKDGWAKFRYIVKPLQFLKTIKSRSWRSLL
jgi:hypothetical protein